MVADVALRDELANSQNFKLKMRIPYRFFSWLTVSLYSIIIVVLSLAPVSVPEEIEFVLFDKVVHAFSYLLLSFIAVNTFRRLRLSRPKVYSFSYSFFLGLSIEIVQFFLPFRSFEVGDMGANLVGSIIGCLIRAV